MKLKNFKQLFERESFFDRSEWFRDKDDEDEDEGFNKLKLWGVLKEEGK